MIRHAGLFVMSMLLLVSYLPAQQLPDTASSALARREQDLTMALVYKGQASVNGFVTRDFSCSVTGRYAFSLKPPAARYSLCTGMGNDRTMRAPRSPEIEQAEKAIPRTARIDTLQIAAVDDTTAVVTSTQTYGNWFPFDGSLQRRAEVRDTWILKDGNWLLKERISNPLN